MQLAVDNALAGIKRGDGGPFGAVIVKGNRIVAVAHNRVLRTGNPTRHAEIEAIGIATKALGTHLLAGCELYSTTEPCPMCFAAIHWAQVDRIYFGTSVPDVKRLGFNELTISNATLKRLGRSKVKIVKGVARAACRKLLSDWQALPGKQTY
jgi:guanine deaminase